MARRPLTVSTPAIQAPAADPYAGKTAADYPFTFHLFAHGNGRSVCDNISRNERNTVMVDLGHPALCRTCLRGRLPVEQRATHAPYAYAGQLEPR